MKISIKIGPQGLDENGGHACDACWLEYQEIAEAPPRCPCPNPICTLSWCGNRNTSDRHMAMRLHRKGLLSDRDIQEDPISDRVQEMLDQETRAYLKSVDIARATRELTGEPIFKSHPEWNRDWFDDQAPNWAYEGSPSHPGQDQQTPQQIGAGPASSSTPNSTPGPTPGYREVIPK